MINPRVSRLMCIIHRTRKDRAAGAGPRELYDQVFVGHDPDFVCRLEGDRGRRVATIAARIRHGKTRF